MKFTKLSIALAVGVMFLMARKVLAATPAYLGSAGKGGSFPAFSQKAKDLLRAAAISAGLPPEWADANGTHKILQSESKGSVGIPNYTFKQKANPAQWPEVWDILQRLDQYVYSGKPSEAEREARWSKFKKEVYPIPSSTATGLGQLLLSNVRLYYPNGAAGIGDPFNEAVGFLRYIADRYGSPDVAWGIYGKTGTYVHGRTGQTRSKDFKEGY